MIKWALRRWLGKFERQWNYDASYMRDMIEASPRAAWLFSRAAALGQFRRDLPIDAWCAAGITAVRHEDCGPCTQLGVSMAERAGVSHRPKHTVCETEQAPTVRLEARGGVRHRVRGVHGVRTATSAGASTRS